MNIQDFDFTQTIASTNWTISHNLGKVPNVDIFTMIDGKLTVVLPSTILYPDLNTVVITFVSARSGFARLVA